MKTRLILPIICLALLAGCAKKKEGDSLRGRIKAEGRLLDASTLEPIEGGTVTVRESFSYAFFDDTLTDANGRYAFDFEYNPEYVYTVSADADKYFTNKNIGMWAADYPHGKPSPVQTIYHDRENKVDIKLPPEGLLMVHMKQVHPFDGTSITLRLGTEFVGLVGVHTFNGHGLDDVDYGVVPANRYSRIRYTIVRDSDSLETHIDSIYVPRFDTAHYYIEF